MDDEERTDIINRLAALTGGMGVLKVGTNLKQEREILSNLSERALTAVSQAHRTGVVPGGGAAFVHSRKALDGLELEGEENFGVKVLNDALDAPFLQIVKNAGIESPSVAALRLEDAGTDYAYDVVRKEIVHAHESGLVDVHWRADRGAGNRCQRRSDGLGHKHDRFPPRSNTKYGTVNDVDNTLPFGI